MGTFDIQQDSEDVNKEFLDTCSTATPGQNSTSSEFLQSPGSLITDTERDYGELISALGSSPAMQGLSSAQLSSFSTLRLQQSDIPKGGAEAIVAEAAENVLEAMSRIMSSSNQRRMGHQVDEESDIPDAHSDLQSQLLHKIFIAALERVSPGTGSPQAAADIKAEEDKEGGHKCKYCNKRTRRQCEMKYAFYFSFYSGRI